MKYNLHYDVVITADEAGILKYWTGDESNYAFPGDIVSFGPNYSGAGKLNPPRCMAKDDNYVHLFILTTSNYFSTDFAKDKTTVIALAFSPNGKRFATLSTDRKVRVFHFLIGKLIRDFDETLSQYQNPTRALKRK